MRFGGEIGIILGIIRRFKENQVNPVKMIFFQTLGDLFGLLYLLLDHPLYFVKVGFIKGWSKAKLSTWDWYTDLMWFFQVLCEILCHIVAIQDMQKNLHILKQKRDQVKNMLKSL